MLYKGSLRVLLVLLHDFPEFLCDYHFSFCDVIPSSCIQLRNLILSAFPRNMRLPDPFTPNLKVDLLPEIDQSPRILSDVTTALIADNLKNDLDAFLEGQADTSFLQDLAQRLLSTRDDYSEKVDDQQLQRLDGRYNVAAINALVIYVGMYAVQQLQNKRGPGGGLQIAQGPAMDIFQRLVIDLDAEGRVDTEREGGLGKKTDEMCLTVALCILGRYILLSGIANQLRYPNSHTHYFSCVLLYLFAESEKEIVKEQVTRVLLERLVANRPHPWGTFFGED